MGQTWPVQLADRAHEPRDITAALIERLDPSHFADIQFLAIINVRRIKTVHS